jgi:hypothetical protein
MISRRKESAAETTLVAKLGDWQMGTVAMWSDEERWGLMATVLVMMQLKVCEARPVRAAERKLTSSALGGMCMRMSDILKLYEACMCGQRMRQMRGHCTCESCIK